MKYIRKRSRPDQLTNDVRKPKRTFGFALYIICVLAFFAWGLYALFGDRLVFKIVGKVVSRTVTSEALYPTLVTSVNVLPGDEVKAGDPLFSVQYLVEEDEVVALATQAILEADQDINYASVTNAIYASKKRVLELEKQVEEISISERSESDDLVELIQERRYMEELTMALSVLHEKMFNQVSQTDAQEVLNITAPEDGVVGFELANQGDVLTVGERLLSLYSGDPYITAYLPQENSFDVQEGTSVFITDGQYTTTGKIEKLLNIATPIPQDLQINLYERGGRVLVRITMDEPNTFAIGDNVEIKYAR